MTAAAISPSKARTGIVRRMLPTESYLLRNHLLRLDEETRRRRFGREVSDAFINRYADRAGDSGNMAFGHFVDGEVHGAAELRSAGHSPRKCAEAAFSVERAFTNQGIATQLMGHVIRAARNRGLKHLVLVCLADNAKMRAIAGHYGADLKVEDGTVIADIVPRRADYASLAGEIVDSRLASWHAALDMNARITRDVA